MIRVIGVLKRPFRSFGSRLDLQLRRCMAECQPSKYFSPCAPKTEGPSHVSLTMFELPIPHVAAAQDGLVSFIRELPRSWMTVLYDPSHQYQLSLNSTVAVSPGDVALFSVAMKAMRKRWRPDLRVDGLEQRHFV